MKKMSETIVFFGSGPVAAKSLELLAQAFSIETVITKPRPPHHRGSTPVLDSAKQLNLQVIEVSDKKELTDKLTNASLQSRVAVLIDFGIIVPRSIIDAFPLGIVNSHFSLLPEWRGADPITFAILSGQKQTGVSLMLLVEKMDEGPLLAQGDYDIATDETTPSLTNNLIQLSYQMLCEVLPAYMSGTIQPMPQDTVAQTSPNTLQVSYSRKLSKEDGMIDWEKPAEQIEREIRAYQGWPKSRSKLGDIDVIITKAHVKEARLAPGELQISNKTLSIGTCNDALAIDALVPAGKKEMSVAAFMAGYGRKIRQNTQITRN